MRLRGSDLWLWLYCIGLTVFLCWLLIAQALEVDPRTPLAWGYFYSAKALVQGHWLGQIKGLALSLPPELIGELVAHLGASV